MPLLSIYKPGQGYWTRVLTACGAAAVVLSGVGWLWDQMDAINAISQNLTYWRTGMVIAVVGFFGALMFYLLNKPSIVEFMIATEAEMRKVHWPNRKEIIGSVMVVIWGTFFIAALLFLIDLLFGYVFIKIHVLESIAT
ncbi:MAG: preprotein translocase subunit SecE [Phycisphaeraceae bacterium]|nr:preprotein translocase subunit SecE [Phycisphaeraceae bacterium]